MVRNVRNFWVEVQTDGAQKLIGTGPRAADGGFDLTIKQREAGCITQPVDILGRAHDDGRLVLKIQIDQKKIVSQAMGNGQLEITIGTHR